MKLIFLDIDGVLNCESAFKSGLNHKETSDGQSYCEFGRDQAALINRLIDETGAKVVISSTWRRMGMEAMLEIWKDHGMSGEIIGLTPILRDSVKFNVPRGCEIDTWLDERGFTHINWSRALQDRVIASSGIETYVIIDDDSDMLYSQRNHFVHVLPSPRNRDGFTEEHLELAKRILNTNINELNSVCDEY